MKKNKILLTLLPVIILASCGTILIEDDEEENNENASNFSFTEDNEIDQESAKEIAHNMLDQNNSSLGHYDHAFVLEGNCMFDPSLFYDSTGDYFSYKFEENNSTARYEPNFDYSIKYVCDENHHSESGAFVKELKAASTKYSNLYKFYRSENTEFINPSHSSLDEGVETLWVDYHQLLINNTNGDGNSNTFVVFESQFLNEVESAFQSQVVSRFYYAFQYDLLVNLVWNQIFDLYFVPFGDFIHSCYLWEPDKLEYAKEHAVFDIKYYSKGDLNLGMEASLHVDNFAYNEMTSNGDAYIRVEWNNYLCTNYFVQCDYRVDFDNSSYSGARDFDYDTHYESQYQVIDDIPHIEIPK